jgi:hypothetical protein
MLPTGLPRQMWTGAPAWSDSELRVPVLPEDFRVFLTIPTAVLVVRQAEPAVRAAALAHFAEVVLVVGNTLV